jgi:drug/metabolite transporter (DMT)-like permease
MQQDERKGILLMMLAMATLIGNDTLLKLAAQTLTVGQTLFIRGLVLVPLLGILALRAGALSRPRDAIHPVVLLRTVGEVLFISFYISALVHLPIGDATAILMLAPVLATLGAAVAFREPVGAWRWTAVLVSFAAVILVIRPTVEGFDPWLLVAALGMICAVVRDLAARRLPPGCSTSLAALVAAAGVSVFSLGLMLFEGLRGFDLTGVAYAVAAGVVATVAFNAMIGAMRAANVAVVMPFRYSCIVWAMAIQVLVFGVVPDWIALTGVGFLLLVGAISYARERALRRKADLAAASATA